jgi:omega-6 fatty acid desaturase (delta-12 desaturase)
LEISTPATPATPEWREAIAPYMRSDTRRSLFQIAGSVVPYIAILYLMYRSLAYSYWLTAGLGVIASGFLMRIFSIAHDCGHGSFFRSPRANHIVGTICGILAQTPYHQWTREHAIHHATSGDLSRRGVGDVDTLTVKEYLGLSNLGRWKYKLYRHPLVLFIFGPILVFDVLHRFAGKKSGKRERNNLYVTNAALFTIWGVLGVTVGLKAFLLIWAPIKVVAFGWGVWMFYVQHQHEETYWRHHEDWDYAAAALKGSSYYKLPCLVQWFSGNIGYHHIHHLCPKIPNYYLKQCHESSPLFQQVPTLTFWGSLKCASLKLWDEERKCLVGFGQVKPSGEEAK